MGNGTSFQGCGGQMTGKGKLSSDVSHLARTSNPHISEVHTLSIPVEPSSPADGIPRFDVAALGIDVGMPSFDVGAPRVDVAASSFDVGTPRIDVGAGSFDVGSRGNEVLERRFNGNTLVSELLYKNTSSKASFASSACPFPIIQHKTSTHKTYG